MAHTAEETLTEAQKVYAQAHETSPTHPGEDIEWWVADEEHSTFAVGTWGADAISFRDYQP